MWGLGLGVGKLLLNILNGLLKCNSVFSGILLIFKF